MSDLQEKCAVVLQALDDWAVTYAPDMCAPEAVVEAVDRTHQHGTLAYIADASEKMREVIAALSEAEQRVKDARRVALEEAAKVAERFEISYAEERDKHEIVEPEHIRNNTGAYAAMDIVLAIRALQSEERKSWRDPTIFDDAEGRN